MTASGYIILGRCLAGAGAVLFVAVQLGFWRWKKKTDARMRKQYQM